MSLLLVTAALAAPAAPALTLGATLPWGIHPGLEVGVRQPLGARLHAGADVAGWVNLRDSQHAQVTPQLGVSWQPPAGPRLVVEVGVGVQAERLVLRHELDLSDGSSVRVWDTQLWAVPQLSTRLMWRQHRRVPLFVGMSVGQELAPSRNGGTVLTLDLGVTLRPGGR